MKAMYHDDLDGRASAAIIRRKYPDCECFAVNYEIPFPIDEIEQDEPIFIVDFTPNTQKEFDKILARTEGQVVWIDHHISNIIKYPDQNNHLDGARVDSKPSGAMLTWQYLYPNVPEPLAVFLTSDFDTWTHSDKRSEPFNAGITIIDHSPTAPIWHSLLREGDFGEVFGENNDEKIIADIVAQGEVILQYRAVTAAENLQRFGYETEFEGLKALACCNDDKGSRFFGEKLDIYDLCISYGHNGKEFVFGLYSKKVDCAALAKKHGGGGHVGAAGFNTEKLPFVFVKALRDVK